MILFLTFITYRIFDHGTSRSIETMRRKTQTTSEKGNIGRTININAIGDNEILEINLIK